MDHLKTFFLAFFLSFLLSFFSIFLTRSVFIKLGFYRERKSRGEKDLHKNEKVPQTGGVNLLLSLLASLAFLEIDRSLILFFAGGIFLVLFGMIDLKKELSSGFQFVIFLISGVFLVSAGFGIDFLRNPFGDLISLKILEIPILEISGITYHITLPADILTIIWNFILINAINFADGADGIVGSISASASIILILVSTKFEQIENIILGISLLGSILGFLIFNSYPSSIMLGGSGSFLIGYFFAGLSLLSGGKLVTALTVLLLPTVDAFYVILKRLLERRKPWVGGADHLHHRLLKLGVSVWKIDIFYGIITFLIGIPTIFFETYGKFFSIIFIVAFLLIFELFVDLKLNKKKIQNLL